MPTADPRPAAKLAPPAADRPPPSPDAANPEPPPEEGAIFRALLDAGAGAVVAYTAEKRLHTMTSETVAEHTRPILAEVGGLSEQVRDLSEQVRDLAVQVRDLAVQVRDLAVQVRDLATAGAERDRRLDALATAGAERDRRLDALATAGAERDRKLDVLVSQMRMLLGGLGLLVTVLIAVFGFLFASTN